MYKQVWCKVFFDSVETKVGRCNSLFTCAITVDIVLESDKVLFGFASASYSFLAVDINWLQSVGKCKTDILTLNF